MLTRYRERAVAPRQGQRQRWKDVEAPEVGAAIRYLTLERGMVITGREQRVGNRGQTIVRLFYQPATAAHERR